MRELTLIICLLAIAPLIAEAESGLRDPMKPYVPPVIREQQTSNFVVNAIFVSSRRRLAIVNGQRVRVGESIDGAIVEEIQVDHVKLSIDGRSITLNLGERSGG